MGRGASSGPPRRHRENAASALAGHSESTDENRAGIAPLQRQQRRHGVRSEGDDRHTSMASASSAGTRSEAVAQALPVAVVRDFGSLTSVPDAKTVSMVPP